MEQIGNVKRVFLIVLDSFGIGAMPDADLFHDEGSNTLGTIVQSDNYKTPNLEKLGLFHIEGTPFQPTAKALGAYGRMQEASMGKDTTIGHWEIAGLISKEPLPTYLNGFPEEILKPFQEQTGRGILCNRPYSGTQVILEYGREHMETGKLIVYTSADSVFQIAAHEDVVPVSQLYEYCRIARKLLTGEHQVGRVIARPFKGTWPDFKRTGNRHDFSLVPPGITMLDWLKSAGLETIGVGKINDIFAGKGISRHIPINGNRDGMEQTLKLQKEDFQGLCFVNLVDFDMLYGHRNDREGYAKAATEFDCLLGTFLEQMEPEDLLLITADHGCDPGTSSTDHSREYTPMLAFGSMIRKGQSVGTRSSFADLGATVLEALEVKGETAGTSFWKEISKAPQEALIEAAIAAREHSYAPYSQFQTGAALLTKSGRIYTGCNIENAAYSPTNCAERTAFFKAVSEGEREFQGIAVVGGKKEGIKDFCMPCGLCRQVMAEFCNPEEFWISTINGRKELQTYLLKELLPEAFGPKNLEE